jgi:hypothetical protein
MPWVRFEPTIPASEWANTVHALDRSATVTGQGQLYFIDSHSSGRQVIQRYRYSTHFPVHRSTPLGFLIFINCILATNLSQSHWHFKSHMESSFHKLIPFLALILRLPIPKIRLRSIPGSCPGRMASRSSTLHFRLDYSASTTSTTSQATFIVLL